MQERQLRQLDILEKLNLRLKDLSTVTASD